MKQIKHLILTPFNLSLNPANDAWMEKRWQIFMDVTYPSFMAQTVMDFTWLIGFSDLTPVKWRQKVDALKGFIPLYRDKNQIWPEAAKQYGGDQKYLLTTRTDCDDALADIAVEMYQSVVSNTQPRYINFRHGLITDGKILYRMDYKSNSFVSRLEHSIEALSVSGELTHPDICHTPHYQDVTNMPPLWMVYVHGDNKTWTMKWAIEHPSCLIHHSPVTKDVFDSFNTNLKFEDMKYEPPD